MYSYFFGTIKNIKFNKIILEVNKIGYEIFTKPNEKFTLSEENKLYIYDYLKDDRVLLCGFKTYKEYEIFTKLIEVNGIGPKKALQILGNVKVEELIFLIKTKNISELRKIKGIGVFAESIVLKLADNIDKNDEYLLKYSNVYLALKSFGYSQNEITDSMYNLKDGLSDDEALKEAIRGMKK